jgi:Phosphate acetyl/butaryl transferase
VADLTILGDEAQIRSRAAELGVDISAATVLNRRTSELSDQFAAQYAELRKKKGVTLEQAREIMHDVSYFGTMLVHSDIVDGMVSGAAHTTAHTVRSAFEIIKTQADVSTVSSIFLMCLADQVLAYGDCAIVPDPTSEQPADIAISSARTAVSVSIPGVAMLSYSTGRPGRGMAGNHPCGNRFKVLGPTDRVRRRPRPGHLRDRHLPLPGPARRRPHHPRRPTNPVTDRRHLAPGPPPYPTDGNACAPPSPEHSPTIPPTRKTPAGPGKPATGRHRSNRHTQPQQSTP